MSNNTIGGLPAELFVGRMVKMNSKKQRKCHVPARLVSVEGNVAQVQPPNHRGSLPFPVENISPWWSKNPDLRELARISMQEKEKKIEIKTVEETEMIPIQASTTPPVPPAPPAPPAPPVIPSPPAPPAPPAEVPTLRKPAKRIKQPKMVIGENVNPEWLNEYQVFMTCCDDVQVARDMLEEANMQLQNMEHERQQSIDRLQELGVQIILDDKVPSVLKPQGACVAYRASASQGRQLVVIERCIKMAKKISEELELFLPKVYLLSALEKEFGVTKLCMYKYLVAELEAQGIEGEMHKGKRGGKNSQAYVVVTKQQVK